nr:precorrin-6A reductase [uncultured Mediterraneibacter sp.]
MEKDRNVPGILIFAGTTEGRELAEYAAGQPVRCHVSVATDYGKSILNNTDNISVHAGRMDMEQMRYFIEENDISLVIDATHPFAREVTENIKKACRKAYSGKGTEYIRCLRKAADQKANNAVYSATEPEIVSVGSVSEAVEYLKKTEGNILIATGSKELSLYTEIPDYKKRCYARVLSTRAAVEESVSLGFEGKHLIAMQGPFSVEMNLALLHQTEASYFVGKESGKAGGFGEKEEAAGRAGAILVVIGRPDEDGVSIEEVKGIIGKKFLANGILL